MRGKQEWDKSKITIIQHRFVESKVPLQNKAGSTHNKVHRLLERDTDNKGTIKKKQKQPKTAERVKF